MKLPRRLPAQFTGLKFRYTTQPSWILGMGITVMLRKLRSLTLIPLLFSGPVNAAVLYDNGPSNHDINAVSTSYGNIVTNTFFISRESEIGHIEFTTWNYLDTRLSHISWSISISNPIYIPTYIAEGLSSPTSTFLQKNSPVYSIYSNIIDIDDLRLPHGEYFLQLKYSTIHPLNGDTFPVFWDISNGPSRAWINQSSLVNYYAPGSGSEDFRILGQSVPEPANWAMLIVGFGIVGSALRLARRQPSSSAAQSNASRAGSLQERCGALQPAGYGDILTHFA